MRNRQWIGAVIDKGRSRRRATRLLRLLEEEIWPAIPADQLGARMSKQEEEAMLGFDEDFPRMEGSADGRD